MKIVVLGASGMIGGAAVREALLDRNVQTVYAVVRARLEINHQKLVQIAVANLEDPSTLKEIPTDIDAILFCIGRTSVGMSEVDYARFTYAFTLQIAEGVLKKNPDLTFIYISAEGADGTEKGPVMWARVRGKTENALLRLPFKDVYIFRPGVVRPLGGIESKTPSYRNLYRWLQPVLAVMRRLAPGHIATTETLGRALLEVARRGYEKKILKTRDFEIVYRRSLD